MNKHNIVAMFRLKNEGRWLENVLCATSEICDSIVILDNDSTDSTLEICESFDKVTEIRKQKLPFDEARDNNTLLKMALKQNPDFILNLAGDEIIEPNSRRILLEEIDVLYPHANVFEFQFLYMWDKPNQYRYDGTYSNVWPKCLVRMKNQPENLTFLSSGFTANNHCSRIPDNTQGFQNPVRSKIKILHYGYYDDDLRLKKYNFYNSLDPNCETFDSYKHIISGEGKLSGPNGIELRILPEGFFIKNIK